MSSRKQRSRLWAEQRIAHDIAVEEARNAREKKEKVEEDIDLTPKKKPAKSTKKTPKKDKE